MGGAARVVLLLGLAGCARVGFAPGRSAGDGAPSDLPGHEIGLDLGDLGDPGDTRIDASSGDSRLDGPLGDGGGVGLWQAISGAGAPAPRRMHTYVWTGQTGLSQSANRLIVWGGEGTSGLLDDGGIYQPTTDTWSKMATIGAPQARCWHLHQPVWTGNTGTGKGVSCLIVWGGEGAGGTTLADGAMYCPGAGTWVPISSVGAPSARSNHTAIWTGETNNLKTARRLIIWGGGTAGSTNSGAIYDPATDTWTAMSATGAPSARAYHSSVWTGAGGSPPNRLIVWGGLTGALGGYNYTQTGGIYDPATDTWQATPLAGAPLARRWHTAVWTGAEMIVWGGEVQKTGTDTGAVYSPSTNAWRPTSTSGAPAPRWDHRAVWTGSRMLVWKGGAGAGGGLYDPAKDSWTPVSASATTITRYHGLVWTGTSAIEWGGQGSSTPFSNEGAVLGGL